MNLARYQSSHFQSNSTLCFSVVMKDRSEKDLAESVVCREITQEILRFGVSQDQLRRIIKLLALELDNNAMMKKICNAVDDSNATNITKLTF